MLSLVQKLAAISLGFVLSNTSKFRFSTFIPIDFVFRDLPVDKRNFCEPLHMEDELHRENMLDGTVHPKSRLWFWGAFFFWFGLGSIPLYFLYDVQVVQPVAKRQIPGQGKHYTFELE